MEVHVIASSSKGTELILPRSDREVPMRSDVTEGEDDVRVRMTAHDVCIG